MIVVELSKLLVLGCRYASYAQTIARYRMKQSMGRVLIGAKVWLNHSRTLPEQWYIECMTELLQRC